MRRRELPFDPSYGIAKDKDTRPVEGQQIEHSLGELVRDALESLEDPEARQVLEMYFYERLTLDEIGKEIGLQGKRGAWWRIHRMYLPLLQERLAEMGVDDETFG